MGIMRRFLLLFALVPVVSQPETQDAETQERERLGGALSSLERMGVIQGGPDLERVLGLVAGVKTNPTNPAVGPTNPTAGADNPEVIYRRQEEAANPKAMHMESEWNSPERVIPTGEAPSWTNEPPWWWLQPPWWLETPPLWSNAARSADPGGPWTGDTVPASVDVSLMQIAERVDLSFLELTERIHALPTGASYADETTPS